MKKYVNKIVALALLVVPGIAGAQSGLADSASGGDFGNILVDILAIANNILIPFILGIGFLVFVWGMFKFFIYGGADDEAKTSGKSLMVWATLGFVLIIIFWGVVNLITSSIGLDDPEGINDFNNNSLQNIDITPVSGAAG
jgi:hypothetical protein